MDSRNLNAEYFKLEHLHLECLARQLIGVGRGHEVGIEGGTKGDGVRIQAVLTRLVGGETVVGSVDGGGHRYKSWIQMMLKGSGVRDGHLVFSIFVQRRGAAQSYRTRGAEMSARGSGMGLGEVSPVLSREARRLGEDTAVAVARRLTKYFN